MKTKERVGDRKRAIRGGRKYTISITKDGERVSIWPCVMEVGRHPKWILAKVKSSYCCISKNDFSGKKAKDLQRKCCSGIIILTFRDVPTTRKADRITPLGNYLRACTCWQLHSFICMIHIRVFFFVTLYINSSSHRQMHGSRICKV